MRRALIVAASGALVLFIGWAWVRGNVAEQKNRCIDAANAEVVPPYEHADVLDEDWCIEVILDELEKLRPLDG